MEQRRRRFFDLCVILGKIAQLIGRVMFLEKPNHLFRDVASRKAAHHGASVGRAVREFVVHESCGHDLAAFGSRHKQPKAERQRGANALVVPEHNRQG